MYEIGQPDFMSIQGWVQCTKVVMDEIYETGRKTRKPRTDFLYLTFRNYQCRIATQMFKNSP